MNMKKLDESLRARVDEVRGQDSKLINLSGIFSELIKLAGKCDKYNSDVLYDIEYIGEMVKRVDTTGNRESVYIGFRDWGTDGTSFIEARDDGYPYFAIMEIEAFKYNHYLIVCLNKVDYEGGETK